MDEWNVANRKGKKLRVDENVTITKSYFFSFYTDSSTQLLSLHLRCFLGSYKAWVWLDLHVPTCSVIQSINGNGNIRKHICLYECLNELIWYQCRHFSTLPAFKSINILLSGSNCLSKLSTKRMSFVSMITLNAIANAT